ncbi:MAG: hypothetical protein GY727_16080 [Gammaproteobacteria bacterium]|nr:hypothetical protein [Gammaproteobacteria bacterium]MCP4089158.1 hypothetical protein [Gammaproteobacteria bacterium]MCP4276818.1 hypothetical protein [Gammaproteobacteria bacterium]
MKNYNKCCILLLFLFMGGTSQATVVALETFEGGANGWLDRDSVAPTEHASGGHDGGAYISYTGEIATNTASFGSALIQFRCQNTACVNGNTFMGDWISEDVTTLSYWFKHDSDISLEAYVRIGSSAGGAASWLSGVLMPPDTWYQLVLQIDDPSIFDPGFGGKTYNHIFTQVGKLQPGIFFAEPVVYTESAVTFSIDDVQLNAVPIPAAVWLFASGLAMLGFTRRKKILTS